MSRAHLVWVVVTAALATVACFIWAAMSDGAANTVAAALGSTSLSVAVATLLTEIILKPAFTHDVLDAAGLRERLHQIGLRDSVLESEVRWSEYYATSRTMRFVVTRPSEWIRLHLDLVIDAAKRRGVQVDLFFAEPASDAAKSVAGRIAVDAAVYDHEINSAVEEVSRAWRRARDAAELNGSASVGVHYLASSPSHSVAQFDSALVVFVPPLVSERSSQDITMLFDRRAGTEIHRWFEDRWRAMVEAAGEVPIYEEGRS